MLRTTQSKMMNLMNGNRRSARSLQPLAQEMDDEGGPLGMSAIGLTAVRHRIPISGTCDGRLDIDAIHPCLSSNGRPPHTRRYHGRSPHGGLTTCQELSGLAMLPCGGGAAKISAIDIRTTTRGIRGSLHVLMFSKSLNSSLKILT